MTQPSQALAGGACLENYLIERTLGSGGFSYVYLARDADTQEQVVIKEYLPKKLAQREADGLIRPKNDRCAQVFLQGRQLFLHEASTLATLQHKNIVKVMNFFSANGTVYLVMAYADGVNLHHYIHSHHGKMSERFIRTVFPRLLDGLRMIHSKGLLHLDIKPGNIHLCPGGRPILLDFGAVHKRHLSRRQQISQVITPGYSPIEQYNQTGYMGPWTDLYAIGATMRACIEGVAPPAADERAENDPLRPAIVAFRKSYSKSLLEAIDWAMEPDPLLRPQSVDAFLEVLNAGQPQELPPDDPQQGNSLLDRLANNLPWFKSPES